MSQPVARMGDKHTCLLSDGAKPHIGGDIVEGDSKVMIEGQPIATVDSRCKCQSPALNAISSGSSKVLIAGVPLARKNDSTSHGGKVVTGSSKVKST